MKAIYAKRIYTRADVVHSGYLLYEDGLITGITSEKPDCEVEDYSSYSIIPGLIDTHIHGIAGNDTMDATAEALQGISLSLAKHGVTSFLPTTLTHDFEKVKDAVRIVSTQIGKTAGAEIIGSYVEGPYLTPEHRGAHPVNYMREVTIADFEELIEASNETIKVITIAPEKKDALKGISFLRQKGILVSMGHTNADYETANLAMKAGANIAVHTFNGMRAFNHREPGCLGAFLTNEENYCELIADLEHVHPAAINLLYKAKGLEKILLISDSMAAADLPDGDYELGSLPVKVVNGTARTLETGSLAGSTANMMDCLRNMHNVLNLPLEAILPMTSRNQAELFGIDNETGSLEAGKKLNAAIINDEFEVQATFVNGLAVYERDLNRCL